VPFDLAPLLELQRGAGFVLVEDVAQAVGGRFGDRDLGTQADYALLSFGADKILRGAGGALVARRELPERLQRVADALPFPAADEVLARKALSLRNLSHSLYDLYRADPGAPIAEAFGRMAPSYEDLIVRAAPPPPAGPILRQLEALDAERARRRANYDAYRQGISNPAFRVLELPPGAMCWRCSLVARTPAHAQGLAAALRGEGLHASNHYFPLDLLFHGAALPNNLAVGTRLVNLWVDGVDARAVRETVRIANAFEA
jgi:dTDP-4-amino-4,6-dideoxygalactose transaminase